MTEKIQVGFRISKSLKRDVEALAAQKAVPMNRLMELAVQQFVDEHRDEVKKGYERLKERARLMKQ